MTVQKFITAIIISMIAIANTCAKTQRTEHDDYIPDTISKPAQTFLKELYKQRIYDTNAPSPTDYPAWHLMYEAAELLRKSENEAAVRNNHVTVSQYNLNGVPVLDIRPADWHDNHKVLVYTHGGAYTMFSARSTLVLAAPVSRATGLRVISVDYTVAPVAYWPQIQNQVINVFNALLQSGYKMKDIALLGDSAGGGLALNSVLSMRDSGMGMPAAVILLSPWADLTDRGDTMHTLANTDPIIGMKMLTNSALAYARGTDLSDAKVSPIYADYSKGFSPTLIVIGTKEMFLSTAVRLHQIMQRSGQNAQLDIYEGMWHVFQHAPIPEAEISLNKINHFLQHQFSTSQKLIVSRA
jgi:epsilon-lactone hydrolase